MNKCEASSSLIFNLQSQIEKLDQTLIRKKRGGATSTPPADDYTSPYRLFPTGLAANMNEVKLALTSYRRTSCYTRSNSNWLPEFGASGRFAVGPLSDYLPLQWWIQKNHLPRDGCSVCEPIHTKQAHKASCDYQRRERKKICVPAAANSFFFFFALTVVFRCLYIH